MFNDDVDDENTHATLFEFFFFFVCVFLLLFPSTGFQNMLLYAFNMLYSGSLWESCGTLTLSLSLAGSLCLGEIWKYLNLFDLWCCCCCFCCGYENHRNTWNAARLLCCSQFNLNPIKPWHENCFICMSSKMGLDTIQRYRNIFFFFFNTFLLFFFSFFVIFCLKFTLVSTFCSVAK